MLQTLRFEGKSLEEARGNLRNATGKDVDSLEVKRHGRELYGGLLGFFQKERYVIEVAPYLSGNTLHENLRANPQTERFGDMPLQQGNRFHHTKATLAPKRENMAPRSSDGLERLVEDTADSVNVNFDRELQLVLNDAHSLFDTQKTPAKISESQSIANLSAGTDFYPNRTPEGFSSISDAELALTPEGIDLKDDRVLKTQPRKPQSFSEQKSPNKDLDQLDDLAKIDEINAAFDTDILGFLKTIKAPVALPTKTSFVLGLIGDLDLAGTAFATINEAYGNEIELIIMSDRNIARSNMNAIKVKSPQELGTIIIEKRLLQKKSVVIFDQKSHLDAIQKSIMVTVPNALWAVVDADYDINQVRALDLCTNGIDALMLYHIVDANKPLMLLGEKWPIAYIDGWRASKVSILAKLLEAKDLL